MGYNISEIKISVIIPTFKPQCYIWECLDSLYGQTLPKNTFEVIVILNGCKEPYLSQLNKYITEHVDLRIKCIQTNDSGASNARNIGIENAEGEFITFVDDDDYVSPLYLEELFMLSDIRTIALSYELAFDDGTDIFYPYYITKEYDRFHGIGVLPFYKPRRFFNGPVYKLIHRDIIGNRRFNTSFRNSEDALFMLLLSDKFVNVTFTSKDAVYYRRLRYDSASRGGRSHFIYRLKNGIRLINETIRIYLSNMQSYKLSFFIRQVLGFVRDIIFWK